MDSTGRVPTSPAYTVTAAPELLDVGAVALNKAVLLVSPVVAPIVAPSPLFELVQVLRSWNVALLRELLYVQTIVLPPSPGAIVKVLLVCPFVPLNAPPPHDSVVL